jgi:hypothetical protein
MPGHGNVREKQVGRNKACKLKRGFAVIGSDDCETALLERMVDKVSAMTRSSSTIRITGGSSWIARESWQYPE